MLNGTGKVGVAAYWKRFLQGKGFTNVVMADYEYSRAAEPPVQCGVSHLSRRTEPHCL